MDAPEHPRYTRDLAYAQSPPCSYVLPKMTTNYSRNLVLHITHEFLRHKLPRLPGWVARNGPRFERKYNADPGVLAELGASSLEIDPYAREACFAWAGREFTLLVRVPQTDRAVTPIALSLPNEIRADTPLSRNFLRAVVSSFVEKQLPKMKDWAYKRRFKLGESLKVDPALIEDLCRETCNVNARALSFVWAEKQADVSVSVQWRHYSQNEES